MAIHFVRNDGGRAAAGYKGNANDCVCRAIAIATGQDYQTVYDALNHEATYERPRRKKRSDARTGVHIRTIRIYLDRLGWQWIPTMHIGSGCKVHLRRDELPTDRPLIVSVSRHVTTMMYGLVHDTHDPSRNGTRCVYGYWQPGPHATHVNTR